MTDPSFFSESTPGRLSSRLLVISAAVLWSTSGFFVKAPVFADWPGPVLAFWRAVFASVLLFPMVRRVRWSVRLIPMIVAFAAMNYTYLTAIVQAGPSNAIWLQSTAPVWVFLIGVFWLKESTHRRDWFLLLFCTLGVGVILFYEAQGKAIGGVIYGLLAGVAYAAVVLSLRQLRGFDGAWLIALNHLVTVIVLAPFAYQSEYQPSGWQWLYLAGFGIFQMGLPYLLFARGLRRLTGHEASGLALLEPMLVPIWVYLAWHDKPHWWTLVGGALILAGLLLRYVGAKRPVQIQT